MQGTLPLNVVSNIFRAGAHGWSQFQINFCANLSTRLCCGNIYLMKPLYNGSELEIARKTLMHLRKQADDKEQLEHVIFE